jgi:hypothetical protein
MGEQSAPDAEPGICVDVGIKAGVADDGCVDVVIGSSVDLPEGTVLAAVSRNV